MLKYIVILLDLYLVSGLTNSFGRKNPLKFYPDSDRNNDLFKISSSEASTISKSWLDKIILDYKNSKLKNLDEIHIVDSINKLEEYIGIHRKKNDVYLKWKPMSNKKKRIPIFLIAYEIDDDNKKVVIKQLVQSPMWNHGQIESNELRLALFDYIRIICDYAVDLEYLYEHDLRYKLSWVTWYEKNEKFDKYL